MAKPRVTDAEIVAALQRGMTVQAIITTFAVSHRRVRRVIAETGVRRPPSRNTWTDDEDAVLEEYAHLPADTLGQMIERSTAAVVNRQKYLKAAGRIPRRRSVRADLIAGAVRSGATPDQAAERFGVTTRRVYDVIAQYGIDQQKRMHSAIRAARRDAHRSQAEVAASLGISQASYANIEGNIAGPRTLSFAMVSRIAAELNLDPDALFALEERIPDDILDALKGNLVAIKQVREVLGIPLDRIKDTTAEEPGS
jgi:transcriptional regulator with XRE-family HTH domain/uncharacterized protein (DUF433 family)